MVKACIIKDAEVQGPGVELIDFRNLAALENVGQFVGNAVQCDTV